MTYLSLLCIVVAIYIALDVKKRGIPLLVGIVAIIGAVLLPIIVIPLYFIFRSQIRIVRPQARKQPAREQQPRKQVGSMQICPKCGHESSHGSATCSECGNALRLS